MTDEQTILDLFKNDDFAGKCHCKLVGVRGPKSGPNRIGIYDDLIYRIIGDQITEWEASTDPGWYYVQNPCNPDGCARLRPGMWFFELGLHHGHPALTQAIPFNVDRLDTQGNAKGTEQGFMGINLHSGGPPDENGSFGSWSAGCQIIESDVPWKDQWLDFFTPIKEDMLSQKQTRIPYLLIQRDDQRWSVNDPGEIS